MGISSGISCDELLLPSLVLSDEFRARRLVGLKNQVGIFLRTLKMQKKRNYLEYYRRGYFIWTAIKIGSPELSSPYLKI